MTRETYSPGSEQERTRAYFQIPADKIMNRETQAAPVNKVSEQKTMKMRNERKTCAGGCGVWCRKYFWEGQQLTTAQQQKLDEVNDADLPLHKRILLKQRRLIAFITPALFVHFFWWGVMIKYSLWDYFKTKYFMSITMVFGSMVAGLTSEGGGAVAFPVMTLGFGIKPSTARDFSMMIQSVGMTCAAVTIILMKVQIEWHSIILSSLGGVGGMIFGLHLIDPLLSPPQKKMFFVSIWFAFASVLLFINRQHKRRTHDKIADFKVWKGIVLIITGFVGGIFTSFAGSGLDICSFSILTLLFRISEKVATPTSIILMAGNSLVGFYWRGVMLQAIEQESWQFFIVCIPVVVFGAPLGSLIGTHFHRLVLAALVIVIDLAALIGAYAIVKLTPTLIGVSVGIIVGGVFLFWVLSFLGQKLLARWERDNPDHHVTETATSLPAEPTQPAVSNGHINSAFTKADEKAAIPSGSQLRGTHGLPHYSPDPDVAYVDKEGNTHIGEIMYPRQEAVEQNSKQTGHPDAIDFVTIGGQVYALVKPIVVAGNVSALPLDQSQSPLSGTSEPKEKHTIRVGYTETDSKGYGILKTELKNTSQL